MNPTEELPEATPGMVVHSLCDGRPSECLSCGWRGVPSFAGVKTGPPRFPLADARHPRTGPRSWKIVAARVVHTCPACDVDTAAVLRSIVGAGTVRRETPKVGRNEPCPCGSGKKFKRCCGA